MRTIEKVATKDIIMFTIEEMKREARPIINFFCSDSTKSLLEKNQFFKIFIKTFRTDLIQYIGIRNLEIVP